MVVWYKQEKRKYRCSRPVYCSHFRDGYFGPWTSQCSQTYWGKIVEHCSPWVLTRNFFVMATHQLQMFDSFTYYPGWYSCWTCSKPLQNLWFWVWFPNWGYQLSIDFKEINYQIWLYLFPFITHALLDYNRLQIIFDRLERLILKHWRRKPLNWGNRELLQGNR